MERVKIESITDIFAEYVAEEDYILDPVSLQALKTALMDYVAIVSVAKDEETIKIMEDYLRKDLNSNMDSVTTRAILYGMLSHIQDFDDIHDYMSLHLEAPVFSAAFAAAEYAEASGRLFAEAVLKGMQLMTALSEGIMPEHYSKGWIATSTLGIFGAVASAGTVLKLNKEQMINAFGLAASCSSGLQLSLGSMAKSYQVANAAKNGVECALLAKRGFTGKAGIFDTNYLDMVSDRVDKEAMEAKLHGPCAMLELRYKQFPCGVPTHPGIINCNKIMKENNLRLSDIERIQLWTYPRGRRLTGNLCPETPLQGKFSIAYCAAASIVYGYVNSGTFSWDVLNNEDLQIIIKKIEIDADPELNDTRGGRAVITTTDGRIFKEETHLFGKAIKLEDQTVAVESKYDMLMSDMTFKDELKENVLKLEALTNIREISSLLL